jgi:hypothetical protein
MARSSLAYIPGFSMKFFFQPSTFWLKIEQFWPFEEISIFSNSGHLEWRAGLLDTILKGTIPARFGLIWFSGFRGTKMAAKLKNKKRGDEMLIVHCCFSINQNELKF